MLESITGESLHVDVIQQEVTEEDEELRLYRESVLRLPQADLIVSQNYCRIDAAYIPSVLLRSIQGKASGIGSIMKELEVCTLRKVTGKGWASRERLGAFHAKPIQLLFEPSVSSVPFKQYTIQFSPHHQPGMYMLEYFNPLMLEQCLLSEQSRLMKLAY